MGLRSVVTDRSASFTGAPPKRRLSGAIRFALYRPGWVRLNLVRLVGGEDSNAGVPLEEGELAWRGAVLFTRPLEVARLVWQRVGGSGAAIEFVSA